MKAKINYVLRRILINEIISNILNEIIKINFLRFQKCSIFIIKLKIQYSKIIILLKK